MYFTSNDESQNTFVFSTNTLYIRSKKDKGIDYILSQKSKGVYTFKRKPLYTAFLQSIKLSVYIIGMTLDKDPVALEQNNYLTKIVNVYIVYDLDAWPRNPTKNFKSKNCLFGVTSIIKNSDKEMYANSDQRITFHSTGSWSFNNDTTRSAIIFGADNSLSSHTDNHKNTFLVLGEGPTFGINGSFCTPEKKFTINFNNSNTAFCLNLHYNVDNSYLFVNGKEIFKFEANNKNVNFPAHFCFRSISNGFSAIKSREESLNRNVYGFPHDCNSIDKSYMLNTHKYLMNKNNL